jgi:cell division transport system permease protein
MKRPSLTIKIYLLRHLQVMLYSLGQLWRQPIASLMTTTVIAIAIALPAALYVLLQNSYNLSEQWDSSSQITVFMKQTIDEKTAEHLAKDIQGWPNVAETHYQSAAQSLKEFRELSGLNDLLDTLPTNPLPAVIIVTPADPNPNLTELQSLQQQLEQLTSTDQVQLDMEWLQRLKSINQLLARGVNFLSLLLTLSVLLAIGNTIRLAILNRQSEIRVMKLVGATDHFIRRPFLYTGFWYGLLGGILAWLTIIGLMIVLDEPVQQLSQHYGNAIQLQWFSAALLFYLPFLGSSLGTLGAWLAVSRHLSAIEPS